MSAVKSLKPAEVKALLDEGRALLVDVREPMEHAREHIPGAILAPFDTISRDAIPRPEGRIVIFYCRSGSRTEWASERLLDCGAPELATLEGGLEAWKAAGLPTLLDRRRPIDLMRQTQITAGALVLAGVLLAAFVNPWFLVLSAFVGAGLIVAGLTGFCGMARLLRMMPWNRRGIRSLAAA